MKHFVSEPNISNECHFTGGCMSSHSTAVCAKMCWRHSWKESIEKIETLREMQSMVENESLRKTKVTLIYFED
jgi:hypothetical protein